LDDTISIGNPHQFITIELHEVERVDEDVTAHGLSDPGGIGLNVRILRQLVRFGLSHRRRESVDRPELHLRPRGVRRQSREDRILRGRKRRGPTLHRASLRRGTGELIAQDDNDIVRHTGLGGLRLRA